MKNPKKRKPSRSGPKNRCRKLSTGSGVDLTTIDAIGVETVQVVLSEHESDLNRFRTEKEFVLHVTLAPHRPIRGGKPVKKKSSQYACG